MHFDLYACFGRKNVNNKQRLLLLIVLLLLQPMANSQPVLVLNAVGQPPLNTSTKDGFIDEVVREAVSRIGYQLIINRLPAERALRNANNGLADGEMSRVKGIDKLYRNLIRIPEKLMDWEFVVLSKKPINLQQGWDSLANKTVAFIRGWKILEKNVPKNAAITKTRSSQQLFTLLKKDRADFIIFEHWGANHLIKQFRLDNVKPRLPALAKREMFIYLHKKHGILVSKLTQTLAEMKKDGSYDRLVIKHLTSPLKSN